MIWGSCLLETYRATLQTLKKAPKEDLHEYAARVQGLMGKAYDGLEGAELFVNLTIEYVVNGIAEADLAYYVLEEALDMIAWHECCKGPNRRRTAIRQVAEERDEMDIRRFDQRHFVTEARIWQGTAGKLH